MTAPNLYLVTYTGYDKVSKLSLGEWKEHIRAYNAQDALTIAEFKTKRHTIMSEEIRVKNIECAYCTCGVSNGPKANLIMNKYGRFHYIACLMYSQRDEP